MYSVPDRAVCAHTLTVWSRFENKYIIDPRLVPAMRQFLLTVARVDPFTRSTSSGEYPVCSLYFDTEDLLCYRQTKSGAKSRFKLRVRTYSDAADAPVFLEVKARLDRIVRKRRVPLTRTEAIAAISGDRPSWEICRVRDGHDDLDHFVGQMALTRCRPLVRVRYLREAYVGFDPEPVRVTFDTRVEFQPTFGPEIRHDGGCWLPVPLGGVVLEIKFTGAGPAWVTHLVRAFNLNQLSCCKFARAVGRMLHVGAREGSPVGGLRSIALPAETGL